MLVPLRTRIDTSGSRGGATEEEPSSNDIPSRERSIQMSRMAFVPGENAAPATNSKSQYIGPELLTVSAPGTDRPLFGRLPISALLRRLTGRSYGLHRTVVMTPDP